MTKTASTADINSSLQSATVADLDVSPQRITYTMTPTKAVQRGGDENVKRVAESEALERNGGGDLLVNPEFVISKRRGLFSSKITSVTVSGRPATYTNIRSFNDSVWCNPVFRGIVASRHFADINPLMPEAVTPKEKSHNLLPQKTTWMIRLGLGGNRLGGEEILEVSRRFGYSIGVEFNKPIGRKGGYWGMDLTFASRGFEAKGNEDYYTQNYKEEMKAHTFQWAPFTFGWKFRLGQSNFAIDPHIGLFASFDMRGEFESSYTNTTSIWQSGYYDYVHKVSIPGHYNTYTNYLYESGDVSDGDAADRFDVGLRFGVGVWYNNKYNLDFTIQRGFLQSYNMLRSEGGCLNLMFRIGYAF